MRKIITIIIISVLFISCAKQEKFPKSLINKIPYVSPYFICRDNLIVDNNYNFILN